MYGTYCIGMVVDPASQVAEDFKHNNQNRGIGIDLALFTLGPDDTSGAAVVGCAPPATSVRFDYLDITFSEPIRRNTFSCADVTLLDPQGHEIRVSDPEFHEGTTFRIRFAPQAAYGHYPLVIGPWIEDLNGNPMDQNSNRVSGEGADDCFDTTINLYDDTPPYVERMTVQNDGVGSVSYIDLTFSEAIDPKTFTTDDIVIRGYDSEPRSQYYASQVEPLKDTQFRVHTRYMKGTQEQPLDRIQAYDIQVGPDLRDTQGNSMDQRVQEGAEQRYIGRFPVCSGFAEALSSLRSEQIAMVILKTAVANALVAAFPDAQLPEALDVSDLIGGVPLIDADFFSGTERSEFFRITAGGAITGKLGFSGEAAGITPSVGAHLCRDVAKVEQGLVVEVTTRSDGAREYKVALALTTGCNVLIDITGEAETFLEFPADFSEFTLGYTFSSSGGISILGEIESEIELDGKWFDFEAGIAVFLEQWAGLEVPVTLSATLSPEQFITAMRAQDLTSALDRFVAECALSTWLAVDDGNVFGLVAGAIATADYWDLGIALDANVERAMGSQAGLGLGFEIPFEIIEVGGEIGLSASAGARRSVNLFQRTWTIPVGFATGTSGVIFNGDFEQGLITWASPSGRAEAISDGSGGMMASLRGNVSELSRPIFLSVNATHLSFDCAFAPNLSSSSLLLQLNGQTVWQATGGPNAPSSPVQIDVSAFSGGMYEMRFLFWNPDDVTATATIDNVGVQDARPAAPAAAP